MLSLLFRLIGSFLITKYLKLKIFLSKERILNFFLIKDYYIGLFSFIVFLIIFYFFKLFFILDQYFIIENFIYFFVILFLLFFASKNNTLSFFVKLILVVYLFFVSFFYFIKFYNSYKYSLNLLNLSNIYFYNGYFITNNFIFFCKVFIFFLFLILLFSYFYHAVVCNLDYITILFFLVFGITFLVGVYDFMAFYLCLEIISFSAYILIGFENKNLFSIEASLKYFLVNAISSIFFLFGLFILYYNFGSLGFDGLILNLCNLSSKGDIVSFSVAESLKFNDYFIFLGYFFIFAVLFFKIGLAPFHFWVPDIYEGSSFFTMLILLLLVKSGYFFVFLRLLSDIFLFEGYFLLDISGLFRYSLAIAAFLSIVIGSLSVLQQKRLKRLFAFTSVTNMGYICLMALYDFKGAIFFFCSYMVINLVFFIKLFPLISKFNLVYLTDLKRVRRDSYFLIFFFILFSGLPPSPLFFFKSLLFLNLYESNFLNLAFNLSNCVNFFGIIIIVLTSLVSLFYYLRLIHSTLIN